MASGVGPLASLATILIPLMLMILVEQSLHSALEPLLPDAESMRAVAESMGYADAAAFRRAFRRWTGASPAAWARAAGIGGSSRRPSSRAGRRGS